MIGLIQTHIGTLLWFFGVLAAAMIVVTIAPCFALERLFKIPVQEPSGRFFVQHWGAMAATCGVLLMWAAEVPHVRTPVLFAVGFEKLVLIALVARQRGTPLFAPLVPAAACDAIACLVFALYLAGR